MQPALVETPLQTPLASAQQLQHRVAGEVLFLEGQYAAGAYVVRSGAVDLFYTSESGTMKVLGVALPGRALGLSAVVSDGPHDCTATTRTDCELGFIPRDALLSNLKAMPRNWLPLLSLLSADLETAYRDLRRIAF
jgi:CRP-like cAMP-binding protein